MEKRDRGIKYIKLLKLLASLSVDRVDISTATAKRTFSTLRYLKKCLRYTTSEDILSGLDLLSIHQDINIYPIEAVRRFALASRRQGFIFYFYYSYY